MKSFFTNPKTAALTGFLFALPFLIMNAMVANQFQPLLSFLRPDGHTSNFEYVLLAFVLILLPIGAIVSIRPMFAEKKLYILNIVLAFILIVGFVIIGTALGTEIYRCDVLQILNCD
ncbi:MAG: hypothetical protein KF758_06365 [Anaerolineales bacterium]|nr:hypothetical protein [Anaerolineales bacterium]